MKRTVINIKRVSLIVIVFTIVFSCKKSPKVIPSTEENNSTESTGVFSNEESSGVNVNPTESGSFTDDLHAIIVNEVLPTSKYIYLNVNEGERKYWVATRKQNVAKGMKYYYRGGLLKTNYESKEYNKVFDTVYLVSNLVAENHSSNSQELTNNKSSNNQTKDKQIHLGKIIEHKGSLKILELVNNQKKYEGKTVQLSGKCVKVNPGIMDRNWIHLKDGTNDDYDLVITSQSYVPEGTEITIKAQVTLNKDFGAGYTYKLILEDGVLVK